MPSSEECIEAANQLKLWAIEALVKHGHPQHSAEMIVDRMGREERIEWAEKVRGKFYTGPYSPF